MAEQPITQLGTELAPEMLNALQQACIRTAQQADLPALEWGGEFEHFRQVYQKIFQRMLDGEALMWVMELPGYEIIGQAFVQLNSGAAKTFLPFGRQAYIHSVRIRPAYRRLGLGKSLLTFVERDLVQRGFAYAALNVGLTNQDAKRLYTRMGYRVVGRDEGKWSYHDHLGILRKVNEPGWHMRKRLQG